MKTKETGVHKSQNHLYNRVKPNPQTHTKPKDDKISIILQEIIMNIEKLSHQRSEKTSVFNSFRSIALVSAVSPSDLPYEHWLAELYELTFLCFL